jgi:hypothetical protein
VDLASALAIAAAGLAAGAVNTVVGSGSLISFPTLLAVGYSPLVANVSNTIGLVPGSLSGVYAYRRELAGHDQKRRLARLGIFAVAGAVVGSFLLLELPGTAFRRVVPFLILVACALVALQPYISRRLARVDAAAEPSVAGETARDPQRPDGLSGRRGRVLAAAVFGTGVYCGYFGAAAGVILVSLLAIFIDDHLQRLNAAKNVLIMLSNLVAGVIFGFSGHVSWEAAGVMACGAIAGGQLGGKLGRRLPQPVLRALIIVVGTTVAVSLLA